MRYHDSTTHESRHLHPSWGSLLLAPVAIVLFVGMGFVMMQFPVLVGGLAAGLLLRPAARVGGRIARHLTDPSYSALNKTLSEPILQRLGATE